MYGHHTYVPVSGEMGHEHGSANVHGARTLIDDDRVARKEFGDLQSHKTKRRQERKLGKKEHTLIT